MRSFFDALGVDRYGDGSLEKAVTDDFVIFEMGQEFTFDEFKRFLESANYSDWVSTQWQLSNHSVWADENAFAVSVPVVPDDLEAVAPWLKPGTVCFCTKQSPFEKGGLVVVDRGEHFVLAQLDGFAETTVKLDPWIGQSFEADPDSVYPVVTIDLR